MLGWLDGGRMKEERKGIPLSPSLKCLFHVWPLEALKAALPFAGHLIALTGVLSNNSRSLISRRLALAMPGGLVCRPLALVIDIRFFMINIITISPSSFVPRCFFCTDHSLLCASFVVVIRHCPIFPLRWPTTLCAN